MSHVKHGQLGRGGLWRKFICHINRTPDPVSRSGSVGSEHGYFLSQPHLSAIPSTLQEMCFYEYHAGNEGEMVGDPLPSKKKSPWSRAGESLNVSLIYSLLRKSLMAPVKPIT